MSEINIKNPKRILSFFGVFILLSVFLFPFIEPTLSGAAFDTDLVDVNLSVTGTISIDSPSDVSMSPDIAGTGSSTGSAVWTVTTNNSAGWKLEVEADSDPAMASGVDTFDDYSEVTPGTPEAWSIATTVSEFGFGATGTYVGLAFGADKYMGFNGTAPVQVSSDSSETAGAATTVIFKAEVGSAKSQPTGSYSATITATATTL